MMYWEDNIIVDYVFYLPDGKTKISKEEFISMYSNFYYMTNSFYVEEKVCSFLEKLKNIELDENMLFDILAWKTGNINHFKSQQKQKIIYKGKWKKDSLMAYDYNKPLNISKILDLLKNIKNKNDLSEYIEIFRNNKVNIGPVYAVTLMYFLTSGDKPIYDRFAQYAIWDITNSEKKNKDISFNNIEDEYNTYKSNIFDIFDEEYNNRHKDLLKWRKVDQALWTYGHCLHVKVK